MTEYRTEIRKLLVVGAGAIGSSWVRLALAHGAHVTVVDPSADRLAVLEAALEVGGTAHPSIWLQTTTELGDAAADADLVIEAGPEDLALKQEIFRGLDASAPPEVLLTTSTSALTATSLQRSCGAHPERVLVAHPFNPPHVMPLVEIVGGTATAGSALAAAVEVFTAWGKRPVCLRAEMPGHVANRLQAALWREAYHLVDIGVATAGDIDEVITWGPGLRWGLLGPFATQHLSGGPGGFAHLMAHLGPATERMWELLGEPVLDEGTVDRLVASVDEFLGDVDTTDLERRRDAALRQLIDLKHHTGLGGTAAAPKRKDTRNA